MTEASAASSLPRQASMSMSSGVPPGTPPPPGSARDATRDLGRAAPPAPPAAPGRPAARRAGSSPTDRSSTGLHVRTAAALCYAAGWIGGLVFLAFERRSRFVRFHAWQSVLALGGLFLLGAGLWTFGMLMVFVSTGAFRFFAWLSQIAWLALIGIWLVMTVSAFTGRRLRLPLVGKKAEAWSILRE